MITIKSDNKRKPGRKIAIHENLLKILKEEYKLFGNICPYTNRYSTRNAVIRAGKKIGLKISPYSLRKTFASLMAKKEVSPFKLAKMMGHSNITTAYKYYVEFEEAKLKKEFKHHPMADASFLKEDKKRTNSNELYNIN
jgi:integrase